MYGPRRHRKHDGRRGAGSRRRRQPDGRQSLTSPPLTAKAVCVCSVSPLGHIIQGPAAIVAGPSPFRTCAGCERQLRGQPPAARWEPGLGEYLLDWEDVRQAEDPHGTAMTFVRLVMPHSCAACDWEPSLAATLDGVPHRSTDTCRSRCGPAPPRQITARRSSETMERCRRDRPARLDRRWKPVPHERNTP